MIDWVDKYLKFYKIGSGIWTAFPIISQFALRGKPILLSTGLSDLSEIKETINFIIKTNPKYKNKDMIGIMQCTSMYPTDDEDINLSIIPELKKLFKYEIGFSDHSVGDLALLISYLKGANILEFHFTDTREKKLFRDHFVSLNQDEVKRLIKNLKRTKKLLGNEKKKVTKSEIKSGHLKSFRRAIYFNKNIFKGDIIKKEDIVCLRPNEGLDARRANLIIGKKSPKAFKAFEKDKIMSKLRKSAIKNLKGSDEKLRVKWMTDNMLKNKKFYLFFKSNESKEKEKLLNKFKKDYVDYRRKWKENLKIAIKHNSIGKSFEDYEITPQCIDIEVASFVI